MCTFLEDGQEFKIIDQGQNFIMNNYKCSKNQTGSDEILWTDEAEPDVLWKRLEKAKVTTWKIY